MATPRRAFLHLVACVAIALGAAMSKVWGLGPRQRRGVRRLEIQLDLERINAQIRILSACFRRAKRRPRYSRREVLLILEHAERWKVSATEVAWAFLVSPATVYRWLRRRREARLAADAAPPRPVSPPCRRIADNRRLVVAEMARAGFDRNRTLSRHLHLQGEKISPRSVGRFRENPLGRATEPAKRHRRRKEIPALLEGCLVHVPGPGDLTRPRLARLLRTLADAFAEGIAADTLRRLDEDSLCEADDTLLRSRRAEQLAILYARFSRIPPRHRPRYTDVERAEILALKYRFRLSNRVLATWFLLDEGTFSDWNRDVDRPQERRRPLVQPIANVETALDNVAQDLPPVPRRLRHNVAETLAALAGKVRTRRRWTRRKRERKKPTTAAGRPRELAPIRARYPNHYWSADLTTLELRREFYLATVIDLNSRDVLAWELFPRQPSSKEVTDLFDEAAARLGEPEHFVSDRGGQFLGKALEVALARRGVDHRMGAVGQHGSIPIIERLWKTAKECLDLKTSRPNVPAILRERITLVIDYYRTRRPHAALGNATPDEVYRGVRSRAADARPAPRGWRGEDSPPPAFVIRHAFPAEKKLPYLERLA